MLDIALSTTPLMYPNSVRDVLHFSAKPVSGTLLQAGIYSAEGKLTLVAKGTSSVQLGSLPAGVYFVMLRDGQGRMLGVQRILKE